MPTVSLTIQIAKLSQAYCLIEIEKRGLSGGGLDLSLPDKLFNIRKSIEWLYTLDPAGETLRATANFLYALCAPFNLKAEAVLAQGGGGTIAPIIPINSSAQYLEFEVSGISPITTGNDTYFFNTAPYDYRGLGIIFNRGNQPQGRLDLGSTYYSWNSITGAFQCFGVANAGEDFQFYPTSP